MEQLSIPRILIAGTHSGCGKTTITCALLAALKATGQKIAAFKCGPDYIDPMFHQKVIGVPSRNLDLFLCGEDGVKTLLQKNSKRKDLALMEGVMGFYDGIGESTAASSYDLSNVTKTPVILVVSCKGKSLSVAAEINGFLSFRENQIKGVILNGVSAESYPMYRKIIETHTPISVLGYLPYLPQVLIESRHLGLVTADEIDSLQKKMELLGNLATETIDLTRLIQIAQQAKQISCPSEERTPLGDVLIGVAMDAAFCFYYADNLDLLQSFGAKLVYFSPLEDPLLPQKLDGIIFGGGYPELYAEKLSKNRSFLDSLTNTAKQGIPIYAECGGWMYLQETLTDAQKNCYPMAGILSGNTQMTERLHHFGYVTLTAKTDTLLCKKGAQIHAHEFHYSDSDGNGDAFSAEKMNGKKWECFQQTDHILAGYPHLHFYGNIGFAKQFVKKCLDFHQKNQK